jgi:hypothetical protein
LLRKRIYYLSGFDPRGAAFYHRLFREESRKSTKLTGLEVTTGKRNKQSNLISQWSVEIHMDGQATHIDYRFLHWDTVIRQFWANSTLALIWKSLPLYLAHFKCRLFAKFREAGRGPYICSLYGFWFSCAIVLVALAAFAGVFFLSQSVYANHLLNFALAGLSAYAVIQAGLKLGEHMSAWWILQTYVFIARWGVKPLPEVDAQIAAFAETIITEHEANPDQEICIVAHCVGAIISIPLLAHLIKHAPSSLTNKLCLVTMGQCIPYLSYIPSAVHFRKYLQTVVDSARFSWVDFGARADPLCFDEVSPAVAEGLRAGLADRPIRHTVKPYNMFSEEKYKQLKKNKLKLHFQYLMAADIATSYDFFEIIAQPNATLINKTFD